MLIFVDLDGVVIDLITAWLARYNQAYDDNLTKQKVTGWNLDRFVKPECGKDIYKYLDDPQLYHAAEPEPGALEYIPQLWALPGVRVVFNTTAVRGTMGAKLDWLQRYNLVPAGWGSRDYIEVSDKGLLHPGGWLVDDGVHNIEAYQGGKVLFRQPWNDDYQAGPLPGAGSRPARSHVVQSARGWPQVLEYFTRVSLGTI